MVNYDSAAENVTVVEQTPPVKQTAERAELEVIENPAPFSMSAVEGNTEAIPSGSQSCLSKPSVPHSAGVGVSQ